VEEFISRVQQLAELLGPNKYLQSLIIAAVFILVGKIADWIISGIVGRIAKRSPNNFDDSVIDLLHRPIFLSFVLIGLGLATKRLGLSEAPTFMTVGILKTIAIIVWFRALSSLNNLVMQTLRKQSISKLVQSGMLSLLHNIMKVVLVAVAGYFIFLAWNINVTAWLASAGIVGLALSFAAKDTLSNLFAGVSIVMDAPYKTGDFIILDSGERGVVTDIGLRSTRILTRDDIEITIPNGIIGNSTIINEAGGPPERHRIRIGVGVAYGTDVDHVIETLEQVAIENDAIIVTGMDRKPRRSRPRDARTELCGLQSFRQGEDPDSFPATRSARSHDASGQRLVSIFWRRLRHWRIAAIGRWRRVVIDFVLLFPRFGCGNNGNR
jgi:small-conductance mechanosensitive channel